MKFSLKGIIALAVSVMLLLTGCSLETGEDKITKEQDNKDREAWGKAENSPLGKYPQLVTYTLGQMSGTGNSNLPEGQTYENNAYTRYLKKL